MKENVKIPNIMHLLPKLICFITDADKMKKKDKIDFLKYKIVML